MWKDPEKLTPRVIPFLPPYHHFCPWQNPVFSSLTLKGSQDSGSKAILKQEDEDVLNALKAYFFLQNQGPR